MRQARKTFNRTETLTLTATELDARSAEHRAESQDLLRAAVDADKAGDEDRAINLACASADLLHFARKYAVLAHKRRNEAVSGILSPNV